VLVVRGEDSFSPSPGRPYHSPRESSPSAKISPGSSSATGGQRCSGVPPQAALGCNVEVIRQQRGGRDRFWAVRLALILRRRRVDVLHVRGLSMLVDSVLAARLAGGVKLAFSFHGFESPTANGRRWGRLRAAAYRAAARRCDDRWAVGGAAAAAVARELRMSPDEFGVLPNGVDTRRYAPAADRNAVRRRLGLPPDRLVVLSVGNLKPIKGHDVLLEAVARPGADAPRWCVVLVGEDHRSGELQRYAARQMPGADVRFVGPQDDPLPWYQAADAFVLPSRWEGMSNALLEAMACGLPVVATAVGGNIDVVESGRTGLLVGPDNAVELALALRLLMKDEDLRSALGTAARRHVVEHLGAPVAAAAHEQRYAALAALRRKARQTRATETD